MRMQHFKNNDYMTASWSGGSTTQLFIYPEAADFSSRDFDFRISSATIEVEESEFTKLSGFHRILMVLEGKVLLLHDNHYCKYLNRYEADSFDGGWKTKSMGKARDLNIIIKEGYQADLSLKTLIPKESYNHYVYLAPIQYKKTYHFIHILEDDVEIEINSMKVKGQKEDLLLLEQEQEDYDISFRLTNQSDISRNIVLITLTQYNEMLSQIPESNCLSAQAK